MMVMSEILGIFMFKPDAFSRLVIRLNRILTLSLNQGGAILSSEN